MTTTCYSELQPYSFDCNGQIPRGEVIAIDTNGAVDGNGHLLMDGMIGGDVLQPKLFVNCDAVRIRNRSVAKEGPEMCRRSLWRCRAHRMVSLQNLALDTSCGMLAATGRSVSQQFLRKVAEAGDRAALSQTAAVEPLSLFQAGLNLVRERAKKNTALASRASMC